MGSRTAPFRTAALAFAAMSAVSALACSDGTAPSVPSDTISFSADQIRKLDSTAVVIVKTNPGSADLKSLVDSTLLVLSAGVQAKRVDIVTDLTSVPLYLVGVHRVVAGTTSSFSTWTLVAIDDPDKLANLIEVSGFAQASGSTPPASASGTIGQPGNIGNGILMQVAVGGVVALWRPTSGSATFSSSAAGTACPNFVAVAHISCALETMQVRFTMAAPSGTGAGSRQASLVTDTTVPAMRLTYVP